MLTRVVDSTAAGRWNETYTGAGPMKSKLGWNTSAAVLVVGLTLVLPRAVLANTIEITSRPATGDIINWDQLGLSGQILPTPQSFTSTGGTIGNVSGTDLRVVQQCCVGINGNFNGNFAPGDFVLDSRGPLTINFNTPVQAIGAQIQTDSYGNFLAEILAYNGNQLLAAFIASGLSGGLGNNSNIFLGVQDTTAGITSVTYLTFLSGSSSPNPLAINQMTITPGVAATPLPAALPFFASGLAAFGFIRWRQKRKSLTAALPA